MSRFWSSLTHDLRPYVPGEQPRMAELVKLNTNENPLGPSPRVLEAIRGEATDTLRLYPDPQATALRAALATTRCDPNRCSLATARMRCWRTPSPLC